MSEGLLLGLLLDYHAAVLANVLQLVSGISAGDSGFFTWYQLLGTLASGWGDSGDSQAAIRPLGCTEHNVLATEHQ